MDYISGSTTKSECSNGGESGWTLYLEENSFMSPHTDKGNGEFFDGKCGFSEEKRSGEEEEEDLSMVSDASSGPPVHFPEEEGCMTNVENAARFFYHAHAPVDDTLCKSRSVKKKQKLLENHCRKKKALLEKPSLLDDTASSPVFDLDVPNNNFTLSNNHGSAETVLDFSQGHSTTHFEEESSAYHLQDQYGFFHSSLSGNYLPQNHWFGRRRWQQ